MSDSLLRARIILVLVTSIALMHFVAIISLTHRKAKFQSSFQIMRVYLTSSLPINPIPKLEYANQPKSARVCKQAKAYSQMQCAANSACSARRHLSHRSTSSLIFMDRLTFHKRHHFEPSGLSSGYSSGGHFGPGSWLFVEAVVSGCEE
jgi:hypothetical protein